MGAGHVLYVFVSCHMNGTDLREVPTLLPANQIFTFVDKASKKESKKVPERVYVTYFIYTSV